MKFTFPVGHVVGWLTVTGPFQRIRSNRFWPVRCVCGIETLMRTDWLSTGRVKSCGCKKPEMLRASQLKHGMCKTPEYQVWSSLKGRCNDPTDSQYPNYGGRGIKVCEAWMHSFEAFFASLGSRPSPDHSIDREDNDGDYEPSNCRWATPTEQVRNRRVSLFVEYRGERKLFIELCEERGVDYTLAYQRVFRYGVDLERALSMKKGGGHYLPRKRTEAGRFAPKGTP